MRDITQEKAKEIEYRRPSIKATMFGDGEFLDWRYAAKSPGIFEKLIETGIMPTTSQLTPYEYMEKNSKRPKKRGMLPYAITISSKLSGCYQAPAWRRQIMRIASPL